MNQDAVLAVVELPPAAVVSERQHALLFFPSRRRPTSCLSDWSSDVCSSDLDSPSIAPLSTPPESAGLTSALEDVSARSEERRVGKECRSGQSQSPSTPPP